VKLFVIGCWLFVVSMIAGAANLNAQHMLIPMDDKQQNHLKAYGVTYNALKAGFRGEWLLNYRGGSFLFPETPQLQKEAALAGVSTEKVSASSLAAIKAEIAAGNMETVPLDKAPSIAIYTPPKTPPWDDAVTLALQYAGIQYATVWDEQVVAGELSKYEWLHLHHEDFTGQYGRFYNGFSHTTWYRQQQATDEAMAAKLGFSKVSQMKLAVAKKIRDFVAGGGFMFAMCSATDSYDIALAAELRLDEA